MNTKKHNLELGYIAERKNPLTGGEVVIYIAQAQKLDSAGGKYAVVCDAHGNVCNTNNVPDARILMKCPQQWCMDCQEKT